MSTEQIKSVDGRSRADAWPEPPPEFSAIHTATPSGAHVALAGELDIATVPIAERELRRAQEEEADVLLDLRALTFIDARGLDMILTADRLARSRDRRLAVLPGARCVRRLLALTGAERSLEILDVAGAAPEAESTAGPRLA